MTAVDILKLPYRTIIKAISTAIMVFKVGKLLVEQPNLIKALERADILFRKMNSEIIIGEGGLFWAKKTNGEFEQSPRCSNCIMAMLPMHNNISGSIWYECYQCKTKYERLPPPSVELTR